MTIWQLNSSRTRSCRRNFFLPKHSRSFIPIKTGFYNVINIREVKKSKRSIREKVACLHVSTELSKWGHWKAFGLFYFRYFILVMKNNKNCRKKKMKFSQILNFHKYLKTFSSQQLGSFPTKSCSIHDETF